LASRLRILILLLPAIGLPVLAVLAWKLGYLSLLSDPDSVADWMRASGAWGPLICIAAQFVQVVIFFVPGEITQVAAGYVFGPWLGFLYSIVGIMLASATAFYLARLVGRPLFESVVGAERLKKLDQAADSKRARLALFLLFLTPGAPKDMMSYGAGFSSFRLTEFVVITGLARTPAMLFSTLFGSQLYERDYTAMIITGSVAVVVGGLFYLYQRRRS